MKSRSLGRSIAARLPCWSSQFLRSNLHKWHFQTIGPMYPQRCLPGYSTCDGNPHAAPLYTPPCRISSSPRRTGGGYLTQILLTTHTEGSDKLSLAFLVGDRMGRSHGNKNQLVKDPTSHSEARFQPRTSFASALATQLRSPYPHQMAWRLRPREWNLRNTPSAHNHERSSSSNTPLSLRSCCDQATDHSARLYLSRNNAGHVSPDPPPTHEVKGCTTDAHAQQQVRVQPNEDSHIIQASPSVQLSETRLSPNLNRLQV